MTQRVHTALIAEDEPLLRQTFERMLARVWPEVTVVARARNGREAIELFDRHLPAVCFLDVHMPGMSGLDVARHINRRAQIVFVTAFDQHAVEAFTHGAVDYVVKPVEPARLADTVARVRERLAAATPVRDIDAALRAFTDALAPRRRVHLRWCRIQVGPAVRLVAVDDVSYFKAEAKYTTVAWRTGAGEVGQGLIRLSLKDVVSQLDPAQFAQIHRAVVVNLAAVSHVTRAEGDSGAVHLKGARERLPVSRRYMHLFRQM